MDSNAAAGSLVARLFLRDGRLRPWLRCIVFLICAPLAGIILGDVAGLATVAVLGAQNSSSARAAYIIGASTGLDIALIISALALRRWLDRRSTESLGFPLRRGWRRLFLIGLALGAFGQTIVFVLERVSGTIHVLGLGGLNGIFKGVALILPFLIVAAFAEELMTRGYLFQNLWEDFGKWPAFVVTSVFFAAIHFSNPGFGANLVMTVVGLLLFAMLAALSLMWTKSLWLAFGMHLAWNVFEGPVYGFPISGLPVLDTVVHQAATGPKWFTGGPFGPEAGVSAFIALIVMFAVVYWMFKRGWFENVPDPREAYAK